MKLMQNLNPLFLALFFSFCINTQAFASGLLGTVALGHRTGQVTATDGFFSETANSEGASQYLAFKFGYADLKRNQIGYLVRGSMILKIAGESWSDYKEIRPEANLTYGFNNVLFGSMGLHLSSIISGADDVGLGKGFQFGLGLKVDRRSFIEVQYLSSHFEYKKSGYDVDLSLSTLELAFTHIF